MSDEELELDHAAHKLLARARRALSPTLSDEARVLQLTERALAGQGAANADAAQPVAASPGAARGVAVGGARLALGVSPLMAAGIAVLSGAVGYLVGHHVAQREQASARLVAQVSERTSGAASVVAAQSPERTAELSVPAGRAHGQMPLPAAAIEDAVIPPAARKPAGTALARRPVGLQQPAQQVEATPVAAVGAAATQDASLTAEVRSLRAIQTALHEDRPKRALALLDELERAIPNGALHEERAAAFAMARCAIGLGSHAALLREFAAAYPASVYLPRVQQSCPEASE